MNLHITWHSSHSTMAASLSWSDAEHRYHVWLDSHGEFVRHHKTGKAVIYVNDLPHVPFSQKRDTSYRDLDSKANAKVKAALEEFLGGDRAFKLKAARKEVESAEKAKIAAAEAKHAANLRAAVMKFDALSDIARMAINDLSDDDIRVFARAIGDAW